MNRREANKAVRNIILSDYGHYSRKEEKRLLESVLLGEVDSMVRHGGEDRFPLANNAVRSIKNGMIATVAVLCRTAADLGADDKKCFASSDYYINQIEEEIQNISSAMNYAEIVNGIVQHFAGLVREGRMQAFSLPVRRAVTYIRKQVYEKCSLRDVAGAVGLSPGYLSARFRQETGETVTDFILREKMRKARELLETGEKSVAEVSDLFAFSGASYFSKAFRKVYGLAPSSCCRADIEPE